MKKIMIMAALSLFLLCGCHAVEKEPISATSFKLNTVVTVTIYDSQDTALLDGCMALCDRYELLFSRTNPKSELYLLNQQLADGAGSYSVSEELAFLIKEGLSYGELSGGNFDITIEPVSSLWDFTAENPEVPSEAVLTPAARLVDYRNLTLEDNTVTSCQSGMGIDLGAIAKGYIADRMKEYLSDNGVKSAIIDLGGNLLCIGAKPDGSSFQVGVQKPFAERNETAATLSVSDSSVVSSGNYERYFKKDGVLYHHILNPQTGYPYENGLSSVTILSPSSLQGDALSTVCFSLGKEKGMELINRLEGAEAVMITQDGTLYYSNGFRSKKQ